MNLPIAAILDLVFVASEVILARWRHSSREERATGADRRSLRLLWLVIPLAVTVGNSLALSGIGPRLPGSDFPWPETGAVVFVLGTALRWWSIVHLGRFFTVDVALASDHRVIDTGPYRVLRHPSYTGLLAQVAGIGLALGYTIGVLVILVPVFLVLRVRMRVEENALRAGLGQPYADYARKTKRLLPWLY